MRIGVTKPLLSICIPTYNRSGELKKTIDSIISQPEFLDGRVELVLSDNCSTDQTKELVSGYLEMHPEIIYHRNRDNIRDANFPLALSLGHGKLRKLNNDTLMHEAGSLASMCRKIEENESGKPVLFWSCDKLKNPPAGMIDFRTFVSSVSYWMTWIGGFSVWEDDCDGIGADTAGCEKNLWQVRKLLELADRKDACRIINDPLAVIQDAQKKNVSYGIYHIFYENLTGFLLPYIENGRLDQTTFEIVEKDLLVDFFYFWMKAWESDRNDIHYSESEDLIELIKKQYQDKPYWRAFWRQYRSERMKTKTKQTIKKMLGVK